MRSRYREMTPLQQQVYDFIRAQIETQHCPPTMGEIAARFSWKSQNAAWSHVDALLRKGLLTKVPRCARGLRVVELPTLAAEPGPDIAAIAAIARQ
jgi:repressor LexA